MVQSIDKIVDDLFKDFKDEYEIEYFKNTPRDALIRFHHGLGTHIRNKYNLWEIKWTPELVDGVDMSPYHPDSVSMVIIEKLWEKVNNVRD